MQLDPEVAAALDAAAPVVALESSVIAQGLPYPTNLETARLLEATVRRAGAMPATIAILGGKLRIGLTADQLEHLATGGDSVSKVSSRDFGPVLARGGAGGTTVAGTLTAASLAGIKVFATGGIGGVHRGDALDISADIPALASHRVAVVSAGAKSILDLPRTLEALETGGVPVIGYGCEHFPAFYARSSGLQLFARVEDPVEAAGVMQAHWGLGLSGGILFTNPIPEDAALERAELESWIETALREAAEADVVGKSLTPFLLDRLAAASGGRSLAANVALLEDNARVAAAIAVAYSDLPKK